MEFIISELLIQFFQQIQNIMPKNGIGWLVDLPLIKTLRQAQVFAKALTDESMRLRVKHRFKNRRESHCGVTFYDN